MSGSRLEHTPESKRWIFYSSLLMLVAWSSCHQYVRFWLDPSTTITLNSEHFDTVNVLLYIIAFCLSIFALRVQLRILDLFAIVTFAAFLLLLFRAAGLRPVFPLCLILGVGCLVMVCYRMKQVGIKTQPELSAAQEAKAKADFETAGGK